MNDPVAPTVNPISLRFQGEQHHIEKEYRSFSFKNNLNHFRLCHVVGVVFYAVFFLIDIWMLPAQTSLFMTIRFAIVCPLFCIGIMLSFQPWYDRIYTYMLGMYVWLTAGGYILMGVLAPPELHFIYFLGFLGCLIFGYTFLRLPFLFASAIGWTAGLAYYLVQVSHGQLSQAVLMAFTAYLVGFELLLMCICYTAERTARKNFYLLYLLSFERDKISRVNAELEDVVKLRTVELQELEHALKRVKRLSGLLPICASCKKIRDDRGYWNQIENYIGEHSEVEFSHSVCPDCLKKLYPEYAIDDDNTNPD